VIHFSRLFHPGQSFDHFRRIHRQTGHRVDIRFDVIRLPRPMQVAYPRSPDELFEHWQQEGCFLVVRNLKEEVVGFIDGQSHSWQDLLWISNLVIAPAYRKQGYGISLLEAGRGWAIAHGLHKIMLEVQTKNHPAISLAQKLGFQFCGYNERYYPNKDIALFFCQSI